MNSKKVALSMLSASAIISSVSAEAAGRERKVTLVCHIDRVVHLNCGGGLRAPGEPTPDCSGGDTERVIATRSEEISVPSRYFTLKGRDVEIERPDMFLGSDGGKIFYRSLPSLYTDAAGWSVDRGPCSIKSGLYHILRHKASEQ